MKNSLLLAFVCLIGLGLWSLPANAQATRTWISGVGDDANPCSRTAPCKTFAGAISKTATGGEINCLDPGGFGGVTITKAISLLCGTAGDAGVLVSGTPGITVNAPAGRVILEGLDIEGLSTGGSTTHGVNVVAVGTLIIRNTEIRDFTGIGVNMAAAAASPLPRVVIQNSYITGNAAGGVSITGSGGGNNAEILSTFIDANSIFNLQVGGGSTAVLVGSVLTGAPASITGGGSVVSYGNNVLRNTGAPTSTLPLQ